VACYWLNLRVELVATVAKPDASTSATMSTQKTERQQVQEAQYRFPYHWIPSQDRGWGLARTLSWGLEYLGVLSFVRERALALNPARVLDFGCGDGRLSHELLQAGVPQVVGVDLSEQAILFARAFNWSFGERGQFVVGDVWTLGDVSSFDVAVAMEVLEHIPDSALRDVVDSIARALRLGGSLIVSVPTINVALNKKHERHYTLQLLSQQLSPLFEFEAGWCIHRLGLEERIMRRLMVNRLTCTVHPLVCGCVAHWYRRRVLYAHPWDGAHLVARFRKV